MKSSRGFDIMLWGHFNLSRIVYSYMGAAFNHQVKPTSHLVPTFKKKKLI